MTQQSTYIPAVTGSPATNYTNSSRNALRDGLCTAWPYAPMKISLSSR